MTTVTGLQTQETEEPVVKRMLPSNYLMQGWCQGQRWRVRDRTIENPEGIEERCLLGAIEASFEGVDDRAFLSVVYAYVPSSIGLWNDAPERTQEEVVQLALKVEFELGLR